MPTLDQIIAAQPRPVVKGLLCGYPGTAKTGSIASLINSGLYNVRLLALEGNTCLTPLRQFVKPEHAARLEVYIPPRDQTRRGSLRVETVGPPQRFAQTLNMLDKWAYTAADGTKVDLGAVSTWGADDVLVIDGLNDLTADAFRWTLFAQNRVAKGPRIQDYGFVQEQVAAVMEKLRSDDVPCNVLVLAHIKLIGPPEPEESDTDDAKEHKQAVRMLVPYKLFPKTAGRDLPQTIGGFMPFVLRYETRMLGSTPKRLILTQPSDTFDVKVPIANLPRELPAEDGLLTIFKAVQGR